MRTYAVVICLGLAVLVAARGGGHRRGHRGRGRCGEDGPDEDAWKCMQARRACKVTDGGVVTKDETCAEGATCAGATTTYGDLTFQFCDPVSCREMPNFESFRCGPVFDFGGSSGRWRGGRHRTRRGTGTGGDGDGNGGDGEEEEEDTFQPPPVASQAEMDLCGLDTVEEQRWYRHACQVTQGGSTVKAKVACRNGGTCTVPGPTDTVYTFNGLQYTASFCTDCQESGGWGGRSGGSWRRGRFGGNK